MSKHECSPAGAKRGFHCCKRAVSIFADCDRCEGDGCAQCKQELREILADLLPYAPKPWTL